MPIIGDNQEKGPLINAPQINKIDKTGEKLKISGCDRGMCLQNPIAMMVKTRKSEGVVIRKEFF